MPLTPNVAVLLPLIFRECFDYRVPEGMEVAKGDYVYVPFGNKSYWGVVWGEAENHVDSKKIKAIEEVAAHIQPMSKQMQAFIDWVAWYTLAPRGMVLKMVLSMPEALGAEKNAVCTLKVADDVEKCKLTPARLRILSYLSDGIARTAKEIIVHARVSAAVVREFIKIGGLLEIYGASHRAQLPACNLQPATCNLSDEQQFAASSLTDKLTRGFSVTLLDGVTGSGKTEVYFAVIEECIRTHKQALVMLPEIALSVQWLKRFKARFKFDPVIWHSSITKAKKRDSWRGIADGSIKVVVGARSALFLPFANLGCIIIDEEHDASYKQEEGVIYHARDMAVVRARYEQIPVALISATPSLETEFNIDHKRYDRLHLTARHNDAVMPAIHLIDMRQTKQEHNRWISSPLKNALLNTLAQGNQAMVFMNRRGYAPLVLCRACGHRFQCPHCTAWLVMHRTRGRLLCHHCAHTTIIPSGCPDCKKEKTIIPFGTGVERIAEELSALFPAAKIAVMTSDNTQTEMSNSSLITAMINKEIDIIVGTQMIAKGHHFAGLALVGVIDADMGLAGGDLRAAERTYQLLHQLSGRAGREKIKGEVYLQTYMPEHPVMQALQVGDRDRFMQLEATMREQAEMPPYGKLAAVIIEGENEAKVQEYARKLVAASPDTFTPLPLVLGPAPAPLLRLQNKFRYRILIKAERNFAMQAFLSNWLLTQKIPSAFKVKVDVEPYSFV